MTKDYIKRQFSNFYNDVIKEKFAKSEDVPTISELVNEPIVPLTTEVGVFNQKFGTATITEKEDNVVSVDNTTSNYSGAFFEVVINPNVNNVIAFNFKNIITDKNSIAGSVYIKENNYINMQPLSTIGKTDQTVEYILTPDIISDKGLNSSVIIGFTSNTIANYDIAVSNTYGDTATIKDAIDDVKILKSKKALTGKKALFLGDSITALTGDRSWVNKFVDITGVTKIANVAVNSAVLPDKEGTILDGNPQFNGADNNVNNTLSNQVQKIINNAYETPDLIIIAIGTNSGIFANENTIKDTYVDSNNNLVPLSDIDRTTSAGAFRYCNETLHNLYPNAIICWCNPIQAAHGMRENSSVVNWADALKLLTSYGSVNNIETNRCGIIMANEISGENGECLQDGLHPNANGAMKMARYNANAISKLF